MASTKTFIGLTVSAARESVREFFWPVLALARFFRCSPTHVNLASVGLDPAREDAYELVRSWLAYRRQQERFLLTQFIVSALAIVLSLAISLLNAFQLASVVFMVAIVIVSLFASLTAVRALKVREKIIELKTVRSIMKSMDPNTAQQVARAVVWGGGKPTRPPRKGKNKSQAPESGSERDS